MTRCVGLYFLPDPLLLPLAAADWARLANPDCAVELSRFPAPALWIAEALSAVSFPLPAWNLPLDFDISHCLFRFSTPDRESTPASGPEDRTPPGSGVAGRVYRRAAGSAANPLSVIVITPGSASLSIS